jgi:hypothetical protein
MVDIIGSLLQPVNNVAKGFGERTAQFQAADAAKDKDMLKVFEYAGDGHTDEARLFAQQKGLQVPDGIFENADMAKGLTLAGKIYGDDPAAAQKFTTAWMANQNGDFRTRLTAAQQAAGVAINPSDREYKQKIDFELWKLQNIPEKPPISRFEAGQKAYDVVMQGLSDVGTANQARLDATKNWDTEFGGVKTPIKETPVSYAPQDDSGAGAASQGEKLNNGFNLRPVGKSEGFQEFPSRQEGDAAAANDLRIKIGGQSKIMTERYGQGYQPTLQNVIATYAPPTENDTNNYINFVAQQTGIQPNQPLTQNDIPKMMQAMAKMEGYKSYSPTPTQNAAAPQLQQASPQGQNPSSIEELEAKLAIARGAPADAVQKRLERGQQNVPLANNVASMAQGTQSNAPAPVQFVDSSYDPNSQYIPFLPQDTRMDTISKGLANATNVVGHAKNIWNSPASWMFPAGQAIAEAGQNAYNGVSNYLTASPNVQMTAPDGSTGFIPQEQVQQALSLGYKMVSNAGMPNQLSTVR